MFVGVSRVHWHFHEARTDRVVECYSRQQKATQTVVDQLEVLGISIATLFGSSRKVVS